MRNWGWSSLTLVIVLLLLGGCSKPTLDDCFLSYFQCMDSNLVSEAACDQVYEDMGCNEKGAQ